MVMHFPHAIHMNPVRSGNVCSSAICSENQNRCYGGEASPTSCPVDQNLHNAGAFCINIKCMHFSSSSHPFFHLTISQSLLPLFTTVRGHAQPAALGQSLQASLLPFAAPFLQRSLRCSMGLPTKRTKLHPWKKGDVRGLKDS